MSDSDDELEVLRQAALRSRRVKLQLLEQEKKAEQDREEARQRSSSPVDLRDKLNNTRIVEQVSVDDEEPCISDEEDYEEISLDDIQSQENQPPTDQDSDSFSYTNNNPGADFESDSDLSESGVIDISLGADEPNSLVITVKNNHLQAPSAVQSKEELESDLEDYDELESKTETVTENNSEELSVENDQRVVVASDSEQEMDNVTAQELSNLDEEKLDSDDEGKLELEGELLESEGVDLGEDEWELEEDKLEEEKEGMESDGEQMESGDVTSVGEEMASVGEGMDLDEDRVGSDHARVEPDETRVVLDEEESVVGEGEDKESKESDVEDMPEAVEVNEEEIELDKNGTEIADYEEEQDKGKINKVKEKGIDHDELEDYDDGDVPVDENSLTGASDKKSKTLISKSVQGSDSRDSVSNERTSVSSKESLNLESSISKSLLVDKSDTKKDESYLSDESSSSGENTWRFGHTGKSETQDSNVLRSRVNRRRSRSPRRRRDNSKSRYRQRSRSRSHSKTRTNVGGAWARSRDRRRSRSRTPPQRIGHARRSPSPNRSRNLRRRSRSRERQRDKRHSTERKTDRRVNRSRSPVKETKLGISDDEKQSSVIKKDSAKLKFFKNHLKESDDEGRVSEKKDSGKLLKVPKDSDSISRSHSPDLREKLPPKKTENVEDDKAPISVADLRQKLKSKDEENSTEDTTLETAKTKPPRNRISRIVVTKTDTVTEPSQSLKPEELKNITRTPEGLKTKSKLLTTQVPTKKVPSTGRNVSRIVSSYDNTLTKSEESLSVNPPRMIVSRLGVKKAGVEKPVDPGNQRNMQESELDQRIQRIQKQNEAILARKRLVEEEMKLFS